MSFAPRVDLHGRIGGEKGRLPDEAITRSQLVPGTNISFDYLSNWDIKINAHITGSGGGGDCCKRMLTTVFTVGTKITPDSGKNPFAAGHKSCESATGVYANRFFGTVYYMDIVHNWNLSSPNSFLVTIVDESIPTTNNGKISTKAHIKVTALSADAIRVFVDVPYALVPALNDTFPTTSYTGTPFLRANAHTKVGLEYFTTGGLAAPPATRTYRLTLQEYK